MRFLFAAALLFVSHEQAHAFGQKKMNLSEVKGGTESQLIQAPDSAKLSVVVHGKGAEFLFRTLKKTRTGKYAPSGQDLVSGTNARWTVVGRQVTCTRIQKAKNESYACAFQLDKKGAVAGDFEPLSPVAFNFDKNSAKVAIKKKGGRGLASASAPVSHPTSTYAMYENGSEKSRSEDTLFVFHGPVATEMIGFLTMHDSDSFFLAGASGVRGKEVSCVAAKKPGDSDRCALVVSMNDGSISTRKNPLFQ